jgi:hypothetical protein
MEMYAGDGTLTIAVGAGDTDIQVTVAVHRGDGRRWSGLFAALADEQAALVRPAAALLRLADGRESLVEVGDRDAGGAFELTPGPPL